MVRVWECWSPLETVEVLPQLKVLMRLDSSETRHVTLATTSAEVQSVWKRVTPCGGFGSEFTLETENVTPDTESWRGVTKETLDM